MIMASLTNQAEDQKLFTNEHFKYKTVSMLSCSEFILPRFVYVTTFNFNQFYQNTLNFTYSEGDSDPYWCRIVIGGDTLLELSEAWTVQSIGQYRALVVQQYVEQLHRLIPNVQDRLHQYWHQPPCMFKALQVV